MTTTNVKTNASRTGFLHIRMCLCLPDALCFAASDYVHGDGNTLFGYYGRDGSVHYVWKDKFVSALTVRGLTDPSAPWLSTFLGNYEPAYCCPAPRVRCCEENSHVGRVWWDSEGFFFVPCVGRAIDVQNAKHILVLR